MTVASRLTCPRSTRPPLMLIERLDLIAYGHFTGESLSLGPGLHVVCGPNEAGKSTALRAVRQMLYGFDASNTDDFVHAYTKQRVGAVLQRQSDGTRLCIIRRKGSRGSLRGADDVEIIEESALIEFLAGIDEATFRQRYGIDYAQLVAGGNEIATGKGDLGQLLFAAGAGLTDLSAVQIGLVEEADKLFKAGAKSGETSPRINQTLAQIQKQRTLKNQSDLSTTEWQQADKSLTEARLRLDEIADQLKSRETERSRLACWQQALPLIAQHDDATQCLAELGNVPCLPPDFSERRVKALEEQRHAKEDERLAKAALTAIAGELAGLSVPEALLDRADAVTQRVTEWGGHLKARQDRPGLQARLDGAEADLFRRLQELGRDPASTDIASLAIGKAQRLRVTKLGSERAVLLDKRARVEADVVQFERDLKATRTKLDACTVPADSEELRRAIKLAREAGPLDKLLNKEEVERTRLREQAGVDLALLEKGVSIGSLEELERLALPSRETIVRHEAEFEELDEERRQVQSRIDDLADECRRLEQQLAQLRLQQDVPTEADLKQARDERDLGWARVRLAFDATGTAFTTLSQKSAVATDADMETRAFVTRWPGAPSLLEAYELSVAHADQLADRLRREADRVAQRVQLEAEFDAKTKQHTDSLARQEAANARKLDFDARWRGEWPHWSQPLRSPCEMRAWLIDRDDLLEQAASIRRQAAVVSELDRNRTAQIDALATRLGRSTSGTSLADLLAEAEARLDRDSVAQLQREQLQRQLDQLLEDEPSKREASLNAKQAMDQWAAQWTAALIGLDLSSDAIPDEASTRLDLLGEIIEKHRETENLRQRLAAIDAEAAQFVVGLKQLAQTAAPDLESLPVEQLVAELQSRLTNASRQDGRRETLLKQQVDEVLKREHAEREYADSLAALTELCSLVGGAAVADLPQLEQKAIERSKVEAEQSRLTPRLRELAAGGQIERLMADARACDAERLPARLGELESEIATLRTEHDVLLGRQGSLQTTLSGMDGGSAAADAELEEHQLIAKVDDDAAHYVRLRLAAAVLREAIERYRQQSQGPVLTLASELFMKLTLGSFAGLRIEPSDKGIPRLMGVRPDGKQAVDVSGMSKGTCDQLYLALRLASLRQDEGPRRHLPLIVDDILIQFDDDRSRAALRVLHELATERQVIFFTHHDHLLDLAREALPNGNFAIHRLERNVG